MGNKAIDCASLYGLVLTGGKSRRMGTDKAELVYHEQAQYKHLYKLLESLCEKTFLSINSYFSIDNDKHFKSIVDINTFNGPFNGIMSAHDAYPNVAWLVIACDLPFLGENELKTLILGRNPKKPATAMTSVATGVPEPLVCIWEPHGLEQAKAYIRTTGDISPKKFLMHSGAALVHADSEECLFNANTLSDYEFARKKLGKQGLKE